MKRKKIKTKIPTRRKHKETRRGVRRIRVCKRAKGGRATDIDGYTTRIYIYIFDGDKPSRFTAHVFKETPNARRRNTSKSRYMILRVCLLIYDRFVCN